MSRHGACAGADAIGDASRLIRAGDADVMVAGGTEACVDAVALAAFGRSCSCMHPNVYSGTTPLSAALSNRAGLVPGK
jgi:3-oxoacyl-[acyl-carrier-protein] synthase II